MLSNTGGFNGPVSTGKKKRLQFLLEIVTVSKNPCLQKTSRPISVLQKLGGHIHHDRHPLLCRDKTAGILWCAKPFLKKFLVHSKAMGVCWLQYVGAQSGNVQEPNLCVCTSFYEFGSQMHFATIQCKDWLKFWSIFLKSFNQTGQNLKEHLSSHPSRLASEKNNFSGHHFHALQHLCRDGPLVGNNVLWKNLLHIFVMSQQADMRHHRALTGAAHSLPRNFSAGPPFFGNHHTSNRRICHGNRSLIQIDP